MTKLRLAITGANGRMGQSIIRAVDALDNIEIVYAIVREENPYLGKSVCDFVPVSKNNHLVYQTIDEVNQAEFDVMIDFTSIESSIANAEYCARYNKKLLIGTTGFNETEITQLKNWAKSAPILLSANTSLGVNLVLNLLKKTAQAIGQKADIEIIEAHHRNKVDSPSGTAIKMGEAIASELNRDLNHDGVFSRHGIIGKRSDTEIGFSTIRAGDIIGDHTVLFTLPGERIEISHKATSRELFANGAVRVAMWLNNQKPGWYTMEDMLNLS